jgi:hypothetical protein
VRIVVMAPVQALQLPPRQAFFLVHMNETFVGR